jgi:ribosomal protein S14
MISATAVMAAMVEIKRYPTKLHVRCSRCPHQGVVKAFIDKPPRLRCSQCGSRAAIIVQRDRSHMWSKRRGAAGKTSPVTVH